MEANNVETEAMYVEVEKALNKIGAKIPAGVRIMQNITGIVRMIENGNTTKSIVNHFDLGINQSSFSGTFKRATGVSIIDIPRVTEADKARRRLIASGYEAVEVEAILKLVGVKNEKA